MKKLYTFCLVLLSPILFAQSLISSYPFNGNADDENALNDGIVNGATLTDDRFGNPNSAYLFDGVDDYILVPNSASLTNDILSLSVWFKTSSTNLQTVLYKTDSNAYNEEYALSINWTATNKVDFGVKTGNNCNTPNGGWRKAQVFSNTNDTTWHHFVATYNGTSQRLFIDNVKVSDVPWSSSLTVDTCGGELRIGKSWNSGGNFNGVIDDIKIYDYALSDFEVSSLFNEGICYETVTVTDTLIINYSVMGYNPIQFANTIKLYPNPTSSLLTIDSDNNSLGYNINIINSLSQVVYNGTISSNQQTLDLSTWTGVGLYFLHLYDTQGSLIDVRKIVLQ